MAQRFSALGLWETMAAVAMLPLAAAPWCAAQTTTSGCTASIVSLSPCLSFTSGSASSAAAPSPSCCSTLESVVQGAPRFLCAVLYGSAAAALGITVNTTRALELHGKCRIKTPSVSQCNVGTPAASPATPTVQALTAAPPVYGTAAGAGSKVTPETGAASSSNASFGTKSVAVAVSPWTHLQWISTRASLRQSRRRRPGRWRIVAGH